MSRTFFSSLLIAGALIMAANSAQAQPTVRYVDGIAMTAPNPIGTLWEGQTKWFIWITAEARDPANATRLAQAGGVAYLNQMLITLALNPERIQQVPNGYRQIADRRMDLVFPMDCDAVTSNPRRLDDGRWQVIVWVTADKSRYNLDYVGSNARPLPR